MVCKLTDATTTDVPLADLEFTTDPDLINELLRSVVTTAFPNTDRIAQNCISLETIRREDFPDL